LIVRPGFTETKILAAAIEKKPVPLILRVSASTQAGITPPSNREVSFFSKSFALSLEKANFVATWGPQALPEESVVLNSLTRKAVTFPAAHLDPVSHPDLFSKNESWLSFLSKKHVLVVHPFTTSISLQAPKLGVLHTAFLAPEMTVSTWSPPMSQGLNSWREPFSSRLSNAEESLRALIDTESFDVALIAAGAYGAPIARFLYDRGLSSIHVGGSLQLLFGVMGNRWRGIPEIQNRTTTGWLSQPLEKPPRGNRLIERGTYW
jgi:hypothetical protein